MSFEKKQLRLLINRENPIHKLDILVWWYSSKLLLQSWSFIALGFRSCKKKRPPKNPSLRTCPVARWMESLPWRSRIKDQVGYKGFLLSDAFWGSCSQLIEFAKNGMIVSRSLRANPSYIYIYQEENDGRFLPKHSHQYVKRHTLIFQTLYNLKRCAEKTPGNTYPEPLCQMIWVEMLSFFLLKLSLISVLGKNHCHLSNGVGLGMVASFAKPKPVNLQGIRRNGNFPCAKKLYVNGCAKMVEQYIQQGDARSSSVRWGMQFFNF